MDRSQIEALLKEVREGRPALPKRLSGCGICPLKIWDLPSSIIIARCAPGCRR